MAHPSNDSPSNGHLFLDIADFDDLTERLRRWRSFGDPEAYDHGGLVHLLGACLDNLSAHSLAVEIEEIGERLTQEQAETILKLAEALKQNPTAWREEPTP